jgi:HSP20 family molecular chaperone IbpA
MSFNNWFDDDDDEEFLKQLREMQRRVSKLMRKELKEMIESLKEGELGGEMHIRPIDGPGIKGYVMWGQLGNAPDLLESKRINLKPIPSGRSSRVSRKVRRQPMLVKGTGEEEPVELRNPLVEKFKSTDEYVILAELPGIPESEVTVDVKGDVLEIKGGDRFKTTTIRLPHGVQVKDLKKTYKNGILEIRIPRSAGK